MQRLGDIYPSPGDPAATAQADLELIDNLLWAQEAVTYAASVTLDFANEKTKTIALTGNLTLDATGMQVGRSMTVRLTCDGTGRTFTPDANWVFVGSAAPSSIAANKTALLHLTCFGAAATDVVARWWVEA